ncbi:zinc finger protein 37 homolog [Patiria miniata]|uniref:C2H2-type domain-containing protein n=1 Tax=Patiria miniata TaxID=46514 RepID=A0A914BAA5_PATMI|nr:zinc finger protein 37 homolog [Patiria miniata]
MEVASGSMILHPDLADELRALLESSGFETAGTFLKHLFALEEQHRSKQSLSELEWGDDFNINQAISLASAQPPKTASVGVQAKLCSCSDKVIVKTLRGGSAVRLFDSIQRGNLQDKTFDSEGVDQSDSDYSEEMEEEVNYNSRKRKQKSKTVKGKAKHKTVPKKKKQGKDDQEPATVSQPKTKRRKPDEGTETVSKPKKKTKKSKDGVKTDGKPTKNNTGQKRSTLITCNDCDATFTNAFYYTQHAKKHAEEIPESLKFGRMVHIVRVQERPHICQQCGKSYRNATGLVCHIRTHTGEQPYKCTQCDKSYKEKHSLTEHVRRYHEHPGEKPFKCDLCDKCFGKKYSLNLHIRNKHQSPDKDDWKR